MQGFQHFPFVFIGWTNYKARKWMENKTEITTCPNKMYSA